jgi:glutamate dehydrogenase (NADP+)
MENIYKICSETAEEFGTPGDLSKGANIAGFLRVATAMVEQGIV